MFDTVLTCRIFQVALCKRKALLCKAHLDPGLQRLYSAVSPNFMTATDFNGYFALEYGDRWPQLGQSLAAPTRHCALANRFASPSYLLDTSLGFLPFMVDVGVKTYTYTFPEKNKSNGYPPPKPNIMGALLPYYWLDPASLLPPLLLRAGPQEKVLDMCAAPGGKTLVLSQLLFGEMLSSALTCNEIDHKRRRRLLTVLNDYVPQSILRTSIRVTSHDGAAWWSKHDECTYDRVLIDAPCSSDRHVVQQAKMGVTGVLQSEWSIKRCKELAKLQLRLLEAGLKALKVGGRLVYSTCSLATIQNDGVLDKVLGKAGHAIAIAQDDQLFNDLLERFGAEKMRHGYVVLPDKTGWGPIYLSIIEKVEKSPFRRLKVNKYGKNRTLSDF